MRFVSPLAFVDVETTGGSPACHRLIEVGIHFLNPDGSTDAWSTLIQPEMEIPYFITRITGITDAMVADSPTLKEIAPLLFKLLRPCTFVAHNASFDYRFVHHALRSEGIEYNTRPLCTVKLSRTLYPLEPGHSLDAIQQRFGFHCENRHRALDDARMTCDFFLRARQDHTAEAFESAIQHQLHPPPRKIKPLRNPVTEPSSW